MVFRNSWFYVSVVSLAFFVSCLNVGGREDENPTPARPLISLTVNGSSSLEDFTADVGDTIVISGTATAEAIIRKFEASVSFGSTVTTLTTFVGDSVSREFVIDPIEYVVPFDASGQSLLFTFILSDLENSNDAEVFEVVVNESPIVEVQERLLGGYGHATYGNLLNIQEDTVYFPNNVRTSEANQEGVDLIVSYDIDAGWIFSAPDDADAPTIWNNNVNFNWPFFVRNSTRFIALSEGFDYDAIQISAQLDDLFSGEGVSSLSSISTGQVLAFRLDLDKQGKIGVMKIQSLTGGKADVRHVNVAYKVQK